MNHDAALIAGHGTPAMGWRVCDGQAGILAVGGSRQAPHSDRVSRWMAEACELKVTQHLLPGSRLVADQAVLNLSDAVPWCRPSVNCPVGAPTVWKPQKPQR